MVPVVKRINPGPIQQLIEFGDSRYMMSFHRPRSIRMPREKPSKVIWISQDYVVRAEAAAKREQYTNPRFGQDGGKEQAVACRSMQHGCTLPTLAFLYSE